MKGKQILPSGLSSEIWNMPRVLFPKVNILGNIHKAPVELII